MRIAVAREVSEHEHRVALVPAAVARLCEQGFEVWIEAGAGAGASYDDSDYAGVGAQVVSDPALLWGEADIVVKVGPLAQRQGEHEVGWLRAGTVLIGFLNLYRDTATLNQLMMRKVTAFSMELIPRLSRAQSMDALSSQASVGGYKAVLMAADELGKFFPMLTTAAGTMPPARVLVVGAGVAGLMAVATARRLGAVVEAFDIRPSVKEEVQSLGATYIDAALQEATESSGGYAREVSQAARQHEQEVLSQHLAAADVVITTAQVPGKQAPQLLTEAMVAGMQPGSVIVDLAAEQGGNCAFTQAGREVLVHGVKVIGPLNVPSMMAMPASQMYTRNVTAFLHQIIEDGQLHIDLTDEVVKGACVTHDGEIRNQDLRAMLGEGPSSHLAP
jgi:NAD(P) transhydrogenase subunit alpha